jgi:hypothetical protein
MRRREFVAALGATLWAARSGEAMPAGSSSEVTAGQLLIPMDDRQTNHLKAYGVTYRSLERGGRAEWLLNYRGGSFLLDDEPGARREAALEGVLVESVGDAQVVDVRGTIAAGNMDAVPLEKAPKVAVYAPPDAAPWDDAVTMALEYAGIGYDRVWDREVAAGQLADYEWLHLHHEDFTGQYSKFFLTYSGTPWLTEMVRRNVELARRLGFGSVAALKKAVAETIRRYVDGGGFLFAMCTATETLEIALRWQRSLAFQDAQLELSPAVASFSDIDGHQVNNPARRQPLGAFKLFNFSAKIDPVPTMLVQCHRAVIPDFYGLTTSFSRERLKPSVTVLADEQGAPWVKYIHGEYGGGTWTFLGGHDPEDPQHQIGDPPTDLSLHPNSPGYRLILNNVLFPAAKKRELKT